MKLIDTLKKWPPIKLSKNIIDGLENFDPEKYRLTTKRIIKLTKNKHHSECTKEVVEVIRKELVINKFPRKKKKEILSKLRTGNYMVAIIT